MAAARVVITSLIYYPFTAEPYKVIQKYDDTDWSNDLNANGLCLPHFLFCSDFSQFDKITEERKSSLTGNIIGWKKRRDILWYDDKYQNVTFRKTRIHAFLRD